MYTALLFLTLLTYLIGKATKRIEPFYFLAVLLALFCGLRGEFVGRDTHSYQEIFKYVAQGETTHIVEFGYLFFLKFIIYLGGTQQLVFLIFASLTVFCFVKFIKSYSNNIYLSLLIFVFIGPFYLSTFNQMRQYLAIGIFLAYLLPIIERKEFLKFIIILLTTTFFVHASAILLLPVYFLIDKKLHLHSKVIYIVLFNTAIGFLIIFLLRTPYGYFLTALGDVKVGLVLFVIQIAISVVMLLLEKNILKIQPNKKIFFNMAYLSIFMLIPIFINKNIPAEIFIRMNNYFFPFMIILVPETLKLFSTKSKPIVLSFLIVFLSLYYIRGSIIMGEFYDLVPYNVNTNLFTFL